MPRVTATNKATTNVTFTTRTNDAGEYQVKRSVTGRRTQ